MHSQIQLAREVVRMTEAAEQSLNTGGAAVRLEGPRRLGQVHEQVDAP
jgi:hypothetical protein